MGISGKTKIDDRGRITIPTDIRETLGIGPDAELLIEARGSELVLSKPLNPEEFIQQARQFMEKIRASKIKAIEPSKVKIWKEKP